MRFKRLILLLAALLLTGCTAGAPRKQEQDLFAMDTYMHIEFWSDDKSVSDLVTSEIMRHEALFSATKDGSDIRRINTAQGQPVTVAPETAAIITKALEIGRESGGALNIALYPVTQLWGFTQDTQRIPEADAVSAALQHTDQSLIRIDGCDVTVPDGMELDLGSVAKGFTAEYAKQILLENGVTRGMLSLGGNVVTFGEKPDGSPWRIGIADPFSPGSTICMVDTGDAAVVTSGSYQRYFEKNGRRYHHILDPETGYPADNGLVSVTVIGQDSMACDALSTALFVMGKDRAIDFWRKDGEFQMLLITNEPALYYTEGLSVRELPDIPVTEIPHET